MLPLLSRHSRNRKSRRRTCNASTKKCPLLTLAFKFSVAGNNTRHFDGDGDDRSLVSTEFFTIRPQPWPSTAQLSLPPKRSASTAASTEKNAYRLVHRNCRLLARAGVWNVAGLTSADIDVVAYSYDPRDGLPSRRRFKRRRLGRLRTLYVSRMPRFLETALPGIERAAVEYVPHHVAHAASAYLASPLGDCAGDCCRRPGRTSSYLAGKVRDGGVEHSCNAVAAAFLRFAVRRIDGASGISPLFGRVQSHGAGRLRKAALHRRLSHTDARSRRRRISRSARWILRGTHRAAGMMTALTAPTPIWLRPCNCV